jgi:cardiolipin synthase
MTQPGEAPSGTPEAPSNAVLTVANLITLVRLMLIPVFLWVALGRDRLGVAFWLGFVIGGSDFLDGMAARKLHQVSKLGTTIDPLFDRIAVAAAAVVMLGAHLVPWPALAVILARDVALVAAAPLLSAKGVERPPVSTLGKWGSFGTMYALGVFLLSGVDEGARHAFRSLAWFTYVPAVAFSYAAAIGYARQAARALRARSVAG